MEATSEERVAYLKRASAIRRGTAEEEVAAPEADDEAETVGAVIELGEKRYVELSAAEQFVLTVSERGFGKRSSSFEYRTTRRGGKGIVAMNVTAKTGRLVGSFPVEESDQVMLVTDQGKLIRTTVRHPHRRALDARRDRAQHRRRRARGVGRAAVRGRRRLTRYCASLAVVQSSTALPLRKRSTLGSIIAGRSWRKTTVATMASQWSLKAMAKAEVLARAPSVMA